LVRQYLDAAQLSAHEANRAALRHAREGFARHAHDTGGAEAQIAALTERIRYMTGTFRRTTRTTPRGAV